MNPGYNHNISYKGQIFHVQTEDSGLKNPYITTHIFVGGNIITSQKSHYANLVQHGAQPQAVVQLMQQQHKTALKELIAGVYDERIDVRGRFAAHLNGPAPLNVAAGGQKQASTWISQAIGTPAPQPTAVKPATAATVAASVPVPPASATATGPAEEADVIDAATLSAALQTQGEQALDGIFHDEFSSHRSLDEAILDFLGQDPKRG